MGITQKVIIGEIPTLIYENHFSLLLALRNLVFFGWGERSNLYQKFNSLIESHLNSTSNDSVIFFDHETLAFQFVYKQKKDGKSVYTNAEGEVLWELAAVRHKSNDVPL